MQIMLKQYSLHQLVLLFVTRDCPFEMWALIAYSFILETSEPDESVHRVYFLGTIEL